MRTKIGDICRIISGGDKPNIVSEKQTSECNIPIYGNAVDKEGLYGYTNFSVINDPAVTIAARGSNCGSTFYRNQPYVPIVRLLSLLPNTKKVIPKYFYYSIKNRKFRSTGSGQPQITIPQILECVIDICEDLGIQEKIADVLTKIDEKISLNSVINESLEKLAKTVYDYWFVQFDFPDENNRPYKSSGGKMVYNEELKREIPEGWKVKNFLDIVNWTSGAQPPKSTFIYEKKENYIRFIQNRDYEDDSHLTYIKNSPNNKICNEYDIMMDKYGDAGRVRFGLAGSYNVALSKISVKYKNLQEYVRKFLESTSIYNYLNNGCLASTRSSLNESLLGNLKVVIPNDSILEKFEKNTKKVLKLILMHRTENKNLTKLRDFLLPMLMNGQINIIDK